MVDVLIDSGVGSYIDFKTLESVHMVKRSEIGAEIYKVPCSKSDVFQVSFFL